MTVIETERLALRRLTAADAPFILELLNDPGWLRFIGDRGVRTLEDAARYIQDGPMRMVERLGFGLDLVTLKGDGTPIGLCGLIKRDGLDDVDIGFAFLPGFRGAGYAREAAAAAMAHGRAAHGIGRIVAIVDPENERSVRLLEALGLRRERTIRLPGGDKDLLLLASDA
ncbi:MAG TPA: GNAT family N-acetyltransferase [Alphaproteobacteria bacterium]|nr:GNAT family N-acetyltransferase [Alphaproteobacteria bacterium]